MAVKLSDLELAFMYQDAAHMEPDAGVWIDRETETILYQYEEGAVDDPEPLPDDIDENPRYLALPTRHDLDLGRPLALEFVDKFLPQAYDEIHDTLRRRGGWHRFKDHLDDAGLLKKWYEYYEQRSREALIEWCEAEGIVVEDDTAKP